MPKISPWSVLAEAFRLVRANLFAWWQLPLLAVGYIGLGVVPQLPQLKDQAWTWLVFPMLGFVCLYYLLYRGIRQVLILRRGLDTPPPGKRGMFLIALMALNALVFVFGVVSTFGGLLTGVGWVGGLIQLVLAFLIGLAWLRLGLILPPCAMGEKYDFSKAWRLSRGHSLRMLVSLSPILLGKVVSLSGVYVGMQLGLAGVIGAVIVGTVIEASVISVGVVTYTIWHERLSEWAAAVQAAPIQEDAAADASMQRETSEPSDA